MDAHSVGQSALRGYAILRDKIELHSLGFHSLYRV